MTAEDEVILIKLAMAFARCFEQRKRRGLEPMPPDWKGRVKYAKYKHERAA